MNQTSYILEIQTLIDSLSPETRGMFLHIYIARIKNPALAIGLNAYFGVFGIDRFYAGDLLLGLLKLLTVGGLGFWVLVDLFLIGGKIRRQNLEIANHIKRSIMSTSFLR